MLRAFKKFVAVFLAIWLPLFSGNALAVSVAMQAMDSECPMVAQQDDHPWQQASVAHQHNQDQFAGNHDQQNSHPDQQNSPCENCGVCHLACSGYLAAVAIEVAELQPLAQSFAAFSVQFQSITPAPLDPPPLARA
ncbi:MAG: DUF2946 domain-containing protein [Gallionellaceae bacterium]|jgi:hypothetical protein|nr:DUF2946 domain-containing protein [Gallionellaceae bacterium]